MRHVLKLSLFAALTCAIAPGCSGSGEDDDDVTNTPDATETPGTDTPTDTPATATESPATTDTPAGSSGCSADNAGWTVGLLNCTEEASEGYTLIAPLRSNITYLIDAYGREVNRWTSSYNPGQVAYLLEDGSLLRTAMVNSSSFKAGAAAGRLQKFDWDGNLTWDWSYASDTYLTHHDVRQLPNGNVLVLSWYVVSKADAIAAGRNPSYITEGEIWDERILEVKPTGATTGEIVWEWHLLDHIVQEYDSSKANYGVVADHPERMDFNFMGDAEMGSGGADWAHFNAVDYNEELDQILISSRYFGEIYVIDHSTTTEEAASHSGGDSGKGGDFLFRWGHPEVYQADGDRFFYSQHAAHWIPADYPGGGNILVYNNGTDRPGGDFSTVDELEPPLNDAGLYDLTANGYYAPEALTWQYQAENKTDLYAGRVSGAQRLENGHTLIAEGTTGTILEVTEAGEVVWTYVNPVMGTNQYASQGATFSNQENSIFRAYRYTADYAGLAGRDLTPGDDLVAD